MLFSKKHNLRMFIRSLFYVSKLFILKISSYAHTVNNYDTEITIANGVGQGSCSGQQEPVSKESYAGLLVGCFGFSGPLRQYFSLYRAVSQREGERKERR